MVGRFAIAAVRPCADAIAHHAKIVDSLHSQAGEAISKPTVLTELIAEAALPWISKIPFQRLPADGFNGTKHHWASRHRLIAVDNVTRDSSVELEVAIAHLVWKKNCIRIDLDGPVSELPVPNPVHGRPRIHEEGCVASSAVNTPGNSGWLEVVRADGPQRPITKPGGAITREDVVQLTAENTNASVLLGLKSGNICLIRVNPDNVKAVQRRTLPVTRRTRALCSTSPWSLVLVAGLWMPGVAAAHAA
mmetsp:Transcript_22693/g.44076  ORF Transcript_22693/g.44076 Transcript_22693/m.44076 type:complete len:248 (+) Transcript_22693:603-1346(+)